MSAAYRSIPAHAGKRPMPSNWPVQPRVYPRVCGETMRRELVLQYKWGLSPRVRGNLFLPFSYVTSTGSIPACAGKPR